MAGKRLLICMSAFVAAVILPSAALAAEQSPSVGGVHIAAAEEVASPDAEPPEPLDGASGDERIRPRIVGGQETTIEAYPWQAALTVNIAPPGPGATGRQICGGTIVAPTIVITAAHCLYDKVANAFIALEAYSVVAGRTTLSSNQGAEIPVRNYWVATDAGGAPLFNTATYRWDVAILEVAGPLPGTPIQIAGPDERASWAAGQPAFISGWGSMLDRDGPYPDQLRAAQVSIIPDADCQSPGSYLSAFNPDVMLCAGIWSGGVDTCSGDSGGPLVVHLADGSVRLVGDTSFGPGACADAHLPGVFGRLADDPMRSWLRQSALNLFGRDIVGPPPPTLPEPDPTPDQLTAQRAFELASAYSKRECRRWRLCRRHSARECTAQGDAFRCMVENRGRTPRGRKVLCAQTLLFTDSPGGVVQEELAPWKCSRRR